MERTSLYRHFDADGRLLYVGISKNHVARLAQHCDKASWFFDIAFIEVEHFDTREAALVAEAESIRSEAPIHNGIVGRPPLNVKPTLVRLTQEALDRIEKVAGPNKRAEFIREAVDNELSAREAGASRNPVQIGGDDGEGA